MSCGLRKTETYSIPADGAAGTIQCPAGHWLHELIVTQGGTALASTVTLAFSSPYRGGESFLTLAAGKADDTDAYPVRLKAASSTGATLSGTQVPIYLGDGKIDVTVGGSGIAANTASVVVITSPEAPAW